ncbi:OLC1v1029629C1 [Oldenlandia corymbosa var. corymbosa]|uniref:OLC1v1029629C1 n=1 Tax=Oldenlandia corymbosa var. corymbosa TaxID=529605 RepID=A0AAV1CF11_OLDCO|nr:OLC1v1029629C1 [Oldenlandia corymbosa var. corymbosa]
MSFIGTQQKCKACEKTVHFAEMMSADGVPYHNTCFRCSQCNGRLTMSNYSKTSEGVLYCRPHMEQMLKEKGIVNRVPAGKPNGLNRTPSKVSSMFCGTQEKCASCKKTVYPLEKVTVEGDFYHKTCFRCAHGGCFLTPSSYAALDGILYCKAHFSQLFKQTGSYNHLNKTSSMRKNAVDQEAIDQVVAEAVEQPQESSTAEEPKVEEEEAQS